MVFRLLLVTDDIPVRQALRSLALTLGAEVRIVDGAEPARRSLRDEHFQGIIVDASLPGLSREEFVWLVRKSRLNAPAPLFFVAGSSGQSGPKGPLPPGVWWVARTAGLPELRFLLFELKRRVAVDRRKQRRLPFQTEVNGIQGTRRFPARSVDLSLLGMQLEVSLHLQRGDEMDLHLQLEDDSPALRVRARVVRTAGPNRFGVCFENLNPDYRRRLTQFLDRHLSPSR